MPTVTFPTHETNRLFAAMRRAERDLHKSAPAALQWGARTLVGSLAAATKTSPKKRPVRHVERRAYEIESWKGGTKHQIRRHGSTAAEIRALPETRISHSGFAKVVWRFMGAAFGGGGGNAPSRALKFAAKYGNVQLRRGADPAVILTNSTGYAESALRGGASAIDAAVGKAAIRLERSIERKLGKIAKGGGQ